VSDSEGQSGRSCLSGLGLRQVHRQAAHVRKEVPSTGMACCSALRQEPAGGNGSGRAVAWPSATACRHVRSAATAPLAVGVACRPKQQRCIEAQIYRLLKRQTPTARRQWLLQHFTEHQRRELEAWILTQRVLTQPADQQRADEQPGAPLTEEGSALHLQAESVPLGEDSTEAGSANAGPAAIQRDVLGMRGIQRHRCGRSLSFRACVGVGSLRFITAYNADLSKAQHQLEALLRLRERIVAAGGTSKKLPEDFEDKLRQAIADEPEASKLELQFHASVSAKFWVGTRLDTPCFSVSDGLEGGLRAWRRLNEARDGFGRERERGGCCPLQWQRSTPQQLEEAWLQLRRAYVSTWAEAGRCPRRSEARLKALEARHEARLREANGRRRRKRCNTPPAAASGDARLRSQCGQDGTAQGRACHCSERHLLQLLACWECTLRSRQKERMKWAPNKEEGPVAGSRRLQRVQRRHAVMGMH